MSIFNELLPKINEISKAYVKNFNDDLKAIYEAFDKFEEELLNGRGKARDKHQKDKNLTTLQSITEDDDEPTKNASTKPKGGVSNKSDEKISKQKSKEDTSKIDENNDKPRGVSKKRSKDEVDGMSSPEQDKRQKRNASVKAQSIISKQVNVNLNHKLRRDDTVDKTKGRKHNDEEDKENAEPTTIIEIKQEKVSLPVEPMDLESLPVKVEVKQEMNKDDFAMPPPTAPVPKPRKNAAKDRTDDSTDEESTGRRRNTRNKKQTDTMPPPPVSGSRSTRASSRASARKPVDEDSIVQAQPEARPKRTRGRKKQSESSSQTDLASETSESQTTAPASPAEKPRPKRTRRGQKAAEKQADTTVQDKEPPATKSPVLKEGRISQPETNSPILMQKSKTKQNHEIEKSKDEMKSMELESEKPRMDETRVVSKDAEMDKTMVLTNGVYSHAPVTPKNVQGNMNETVVLETRNNETVVLETRNNETVVIEKQNVVMDATVVIEKESSGPNVTDDNSILTDDNSSHETHTPPKKDIPSVQPTSAVKEKVQQFEELASRVTRTKTRAMAKREETTENHTPPDKISKAILDSETLKKMNSLIFNGKPPQISSSACKPRSNIPTITKTQLTSSTSKLSALTRARDTAEENLSKFEKEDARKKKEAMLEAKREQQKKKREDKMAAAAAARLAAERERQAHAAAAERERTEKLAQLSAHRNNKLKELEKKKQEQARKAAETEERRKAEEVLRQQRLAEEQKRLEAHRKKQLEEHEAMKKEAAIMAKEIEKRQKEYIEKQKKKLEEHKSYTPLKASGTPSSHIEPVYLQDGFQHLNSDEEAEVTFTPPAWSTNKARRAQLQIQYAIPQQHIDSLFSVRVHTPDLRSIFPNIERSRLKRTSSAVWRTPPCARMPAVSE